MKMTMICIVHIVEQRENNIENIYKLMKYENLL